MRRNLGPPLAGWSLEAETDGGSESVSISVVDRLGSYIQMSEAWNILPNKGWNDEEFDPVQTISDRVLMHIDMNEPGGEPFTSSSPPLYSEKPDSEALKKMIAEMAPPFLARVWVKALKEKVEQFMFHWGSLLSEEDLMRAWKSGVVARTMKL